MKYIKSTSAILGIVLFGISMAALGNRYLGFDVGSQNEESVVTELKKEDAKFDNFSYKGEGSLPFIRIKQSKSLSQHGLLKEGVLMFDHNKVLFGIDVKYFDDGKTFQTFKSSLDKNFGIPRVKTTDKMQIYTYDDPKDPDSGVQLILDESGKTKLTSVMYLNKKLFSEVQEYKKGIDAKVPGKIKTPNPQ